MGLKDIGETLPPGFRFYPSDEELVCHYLQKKIANEEVLKGTLVEVDLHACEPWQLPETAKLNTNEWYFFNFRDRKYATGFRTNRATSSGYWKATGKDRVILDPKTARAIGMKKTLVFYKNRAPNGTKTGWIMHEFRLESPHLPPKPLRVASVVFKVMVQPDETLADKVAEIAWLDARLAPSAEESQERVTTLEVVLSCTEAKCANLETEVARLKEVVNQLNANNKRIVDRATSYENKLSTGLSPHGIGGALYARLLDGLNIGRHVARLVDPNFPVEFINQLNCSAQRKEDLVAESRDSQGGLPAS